MGEAVLRRAIIGLVSVWLQVKAWHPLVLLQVLWWSDGPVCTPGIRGAQVRWLAPLSWIVRSHKRVFFIFLLVWMKIFVVFIRY